MTIDIKYFKDKLQAEKERLTRELETVGRINPDNPSDWEPIPAEDSGDFSDANDNADSITEYENNTAILKELETQLMEVNSASERIENGTYGICEISGEEIEVDRLEANPAARTCKAHIEG